MGGHIAYIIHDKCQHLLGWENWVFEVPVVI